MMTSWTRACDPSLSARFDSISAVQQMMGAEAFTVASPVIMPTFSGPNELQSEMNFSFARALMGTV